LPDEMREKPPDELVDELLAGAKTEEEIFGQGGLLAAVRPALDITDQDISRWQTTLSRRPSLLTRLADGRGWHYPAMRELGLGLDGGRVTIPIRNRAGVLRGVLRYQPDDTRRPKMPAADSGSYPTPPARHHHRSCSSKDRPT